LAIAAISSWVIPAILSWLRWRRRQRACAGHAASSLRGGQKDHHS